jgi:hypothetical protein
MIHPLLAAAICMPHPVIGLTRIADDGHEGSPEGGGRPRETSPPPRMPAPNARVKNALSSSLRDPTSQGGVCVTVSDSLVLY